MISQDSTIYNYTLARKVRFGAPFALFHLMMLAAAETFLALRFGLQAVISLPVGFVLVTLLQRAIIATLVRRAGISSHSTWKSAARYPLIGYVPVSFIGSGSWKRLTSHCLFIGSLLFCLFYLWIPAVWWANLLFLHWWLMAPLFWARFRFRSIRKSGFIRFQQNECGYFYS